ncbi:MAG: hypothetical protein BGN91_04420 [Nitrobacter sp. 62-13]|nr:MAG: hypothetical protein BGN91_04420 [Nitrobacter sp. 62-13]
MNGSLAPRKGSLLISFNLLQLRIQPKGVRNSPITFEKAIKYCSLNLLHLHQCHLGVSGVKTGKRWIGLTRLPRKKVREFFDLTGAWRIDAGQSMAKCILC